MLSDSGGVPYTYPLLAYEMLLSDDVKSSATSNIRFVTELHHFSLMAYGLQSPCLRLTHAVTDTSSRLGMGCAGSALSQLHFQQIAASHSVTHHKESRKN
jgi:hypothetical protein